MNQLLITILIFIVVYVLLFAVIDKLIEDGKTKRIAQGIVLAIALIYILQGSLPRLMR